MATRLWTLTLLLGIPLCSLAQPKQQRTSGMDITLYSADQLSYHGHLLAEQDILGASLTWGTGPFSFTLDGQTLQNEPEEGVADGSLWDGTLAITTTGPRFTQTYGYRYRRHQDFLFDTQELFFSFNYGGSWQPTFTTVYDIDNVNGMLFQLEMNRLIPLSRSMALTLHLLGVGSSGYDEKWPEGPRGENEGNVRPLEYGLFEKDGLNYYQLGASFLLRWFQRVDTVISYHHTKPNDDLLEERHGDFQTITFKLKFSF